MAKILFFIIRPTWSVLIGITNEILDRFYYVNKC